MPIQRAYHSDLLVLERGVLLEHTSRHVNVYGLVELGRAECVANIHMVNFPFWMLWNDRHQMPTCFDAAYRGENVCIDVILEVSNN